MARLSGLQVFFQQFLLFGICIISFTKGDAPTPTDYPYEFYIEFMSNVTNTTTADSSFVIPGKMYYNWNIQRQRVDHGAGSYECTTFYMTELPCTIYFTSKGLYRTLSLPLPDGQPYCCLDMEGIGPSPPDWAASSKPTYNGIVVDEFSGVKKAHLFTYDTFENSDPEHVHQSREVAGGPGAGTPLVFTFPVDDGRQDYHYDYKSMRAAHQDPNLFELPVGCESRMCPQSSNRRLAKGL